MPFFANARNVTITGSTFREIQGDEIVYHGDVYNVDSFNRMQTDIRGSFNDSSDHLRGLRRHHTDQAVTPGSPPEKRDHQLGDNRMNTAQGTEHSQDDVSGQQPFHPKPGYPKSASFPSDKTSSQPKVVRMRRLAEGFRGMKIEDGLLPGDEGEVGEELWDEEEGGEEEAMDDDRTYTTEDESSTQWASPSAPPSSAGINPGASETLQALFPQAIGVQFHQYPAQTWYNGPVWTNNSYNTTSTNTRHSHNDSSINVVDSE